MSAEPIAPEADTLSGTSPYEVIHLGDESAVVVPLTDFLRLRALEEAATHEDLADAEDRAAFLNWEEREAAGTTSYLTISQVRSRLGLER